MRGITECGGTSTVKGTDFATVNVLCRKTIGFDCASRCVVKAGRLSGETGTSCFFCLQAVRSSHPPTAKMKGNRRSIPSLAEETDGIPPEIPSKVYLPARLAVLGGVVQPDFSARALLGRVHNTG